MRFSKKERIFIAEVYYETKSYIAVQTWFHDEYPDHKMFPKSCIKRLVDKFERMGSAHNAKGRGRKNVVMPEKYAELKESIEATPIHVITTFSKPSWVDTYHNPLNITSIEVASVSYAGAARIKAI